MDKEMKSFAGSFFVVFLLLLPCRYLCYKSLLCREGREGRGLFVCCFFSFFFFFVASELGKKPPTLRIKGGGGGGE